MRQHRIPHLASSFPVNRQVPLKRHRSGQTLVYFSHQQQLSHQKNKTLPRVTEVSTARLRAQPPGGEHQGCVMGTAQAIS
jgi:hypothetical protein